MRVDISSKIIKSEFVKKVEELSGEKILNCNQCGKCSAGCPIVEVMDTPPSQTLRLVQLGQQDEVLNSRTIWLCASCFACMTRCPRGVDLSKIMEALRQISLRKNVDHVKPSELSKETYSQLPQIALVSNFRKFTA